MNKQFDVFVKMKITEMSKTIHDMTYTYINPETKKPTDVPAKHYQDILKQPVEVMVEEQVKKQFLNIMFKQLKNLKDTLWTTADQLRANSGLKSTEYAEPILGLIFLRFADVKYSKFEPEIKAEFDSIKGTRMERPIHEIAIEKCGFYLPEEARYDWLLNLPESEDLAKKVKEAMEAVEKYTAELEDTLPKDIYYSVNSEDDPLVLAKLLKNFKDIPADVELDIFGEIYEYFLGEFALAEGQGGGEFFTPASVVRYMVEVLAPTEGRILDPACGSGGMFVQSEKFIEAHGHKRGSISVYGQEANPDTWKMAKMNMAIRGIDADLGPYNADTFTNDLHPTLKADFILANPPFNYHPWNQEKLLEDRRWKYGTPPAGNANYAWIQHMIHHLAPNGKIGLVLANGALSTQSSGEGNIRKNIIEDDLIEGIIAMPTQLFYSVTIPVTLWFITKGKKQSGKTLFIDARKMGHMVDRKHRDFTDEDIQKLADTFEAFQNGTLEDVQGFCKVATLEDIAKQDYILTPGRYVGIEEQEDDGEPFEEKMTRLTSELSDMFARSHELEDEIRKKLGAIGYEI